MIISGMDTNDVVGLLADYYSIEKTLKRKGYVVGGMDDVSRVIAASDKMYELLKSRSRRRILRAVYQKACRDIDAIRGKYNQFDDHKIKEILQEFCAVGALTIEEDVVKPIPACDFGVTFEWFIAEVIKRELSGISSFGVHIKELSTGGDFDVIGRLEDVVLYIECKAGSLGNITQAEISEFIERDGELSPDLTFFIVDSDGLTDAFKNMWVEAGWRDRGMGDCRPRLRAIKGRGRFYEASSSKYVVTNDRNLISNIRLAVNHHHRFVKPFGMVGPSDIGQAYDDYEEN